MFKIISNLQSRIRLVSPLKKIGEEVNENVPCINFGGCCVYAATIGNMLELLGFEVRIVTVDWSNQTEKIPNDEKILCPIEAEEKLRVNFHHVGIAVKINNRWYTHDTDRTIRGLKKFGESEYTACKTYLTVKQALHFASKTNFWNTTYDRSYDQTVHEIVDKYFDKIKHNLV